jgi:hypothetical protein
MRRWFEIAAVLLSAGLHLVSTLLLGWHGVDVVLLGGGWLGYLVWRARTPGALADLGLRREGLRPCLRDVGAVLAVGIGVIAAIGAGRGTLVFDAHVLPLLLLYPLWGIVQQLLVLGIVVGNAQALGAPHWLLVAIAAPGFAAVHVPDWPLCAATFALGVVCCVLFLRWRNLWPLGVLHGWLGAVFYRWVLDRDPWAELLAAFG